MMQVLYPTYTLEIEVKDVPPQSNSMSGLQGQMGTLAGVPSAPYSPYKWFNSGAGKTGCDEVLAVVRDALSKAGIQASVRFEKFEHR